MSKLRLSRQSFVSEKKTKLEAIKEEEDLNVKCEKEEFEKSKKKLNVLAKMYLHMKK